MSGWSRGGIADTTWTYTLAQQQAILDALESVEKDEESELIAAVTEQARMFRRELANEGTRPPRKEVREQLRRIETDSRALLDALGEMHEPTFYALERAGWHAYHHPSEDWEAEYARRHPGEVEALTGAEVDAQVRELEKAKQLQMEALLAACPDVHVDPPRPPQEPAKFVGFGALELEAKSVLGRLWRLALLAHREYEARGVQGSEATWHFVNDLKRIFDQYAPGPGLTRDRIDGDLLTGRFVGFTEACLRPLKIVPPYGALRDVWNAWEASKTD